MQTHAEKERGRGRGRERGGERGGGRERKGGRERETWRTRREKQLVAVPTKRRHSARRTMLLMESKA